MSNDTSPPDVTLPPAPRTRLDQLKVFIGELARPFAIISTSGAASAAVVIVALKVNSFDNAAIFIGAVFAGVGGIYGAKAWENAQGGKHAAQVEIAKATAPLPADGGS